MVDVGVLLLALEDFLPVVLAAVAYVVLGRVCSRLDRDAGRSVYIGVALIAAGGITKPVYKLVLAIGGEDVAPAVLDELLFWFLAPGFVLLAAGLAGGSRSDRGEETGQVMIWIGVAAGIFVVGLVMLLAGSGAWFAFLLASTTVGNVVVVVVLVRWARRRDDPLGAALFAASLVIVLGLAWAAASLDQTVPVQWGEQVASTTNQGLVLWASLRLRDRVPAAHAGAA